MAFPDDENKIVENNKSTAENTSEQDAERKLRDRNPHDLTPDERASFVDDPEKRLAFKKRFSDGIKKVMLKELKGLEEYDTEAYNERKQLVEALEDPNKNITQVLADGAGYLYVNLFYTGTSRSSDTIGEMMEHMIDEYVLNGKIQGVSIEMGANNLPLYFGLSDKKAASFTSDVGFRGYHKLLDTMEAEARRMAEQPEKVDSSTPAVQKRIQREGQNLLQYVQEAKAQFAAAETDMTAYDQAHEEERGEEADKLCDSAKQKMMQGMTPLVGYLDQMARSKNRALTGIPILQMRTQLTTGCRSIGNLNAYLNNDKVIEAQSKAEAIEREEVAQQDANKKEREKQKAKKKLQEDRDRIRDLEKKFERKERKERERDLKERKEKLAAKAEEKRRAGLTEEERLAEDQKKEQERLEKEKKKEQERLENEKKKEQERLEQERRDNLEIEALLDDVAMPAASSVPVSIPVPETMAPMKPYVNQMQLAQQTANKFAAEKRREEALEAEMEPLLGDVAMPEAPATPAPMPVPETMAPMRPYINQMQRAQQTARNYPAEQARKERERIAKLPENQTPEQRAALFGSEENREDFKARFSEAAKKRLLEELGSNENDPLVQELKDENLSIYDIMEGDNAAKLGKWFYSGSMNRGASLDEAVDNMMDEFVATGKTHGISIGLGNGGAPLFVGLSDTTAGRIQADYNFKGYEKLLDTMDAEAKKMAEHPENAVKAEAKDDPLALEKTKNDGKHLQAYIKDSKNNLASAQSDWAKHVEDPTNAGFREGYEQSMTNAMGYLQGYVSAMVKEKSNVLPPDHPMVQMQPAVSQACDHIKGKKYGKTLSDHILQGEVNAEQTGNAITQRIEEAEKKARLEKERLERERKEKERQEKLRREREEEEKRRAEEEKRLEEERQRREEEWQKERELQNKKWAEKENQERIDELKAKDEKVNTQTEHVSKAMEKAEADNWAQIEQSAQKMGPQYMMNSETGLPMKEGFVGEDDKEYWRWAEEGDFSGRTHFDPEEAGKTVAELQKLLKDNNKGLFFSSKEFKAMMKSLDETAKTLKEMPDVMDVKDYERARDSFTQTIKVAGDYLLYKGDANSPQNVGNQRTQNRIHAANIVVEKLANLQTQAAIVAKESGQQLTDAENAWKSNAKEMHASGVASAPEGEPQPLPADAMKVYTDFLVENIAEGFVERAVDKVNREQIAKTGKALDNNSIYELRRRVREEKLPEFEEKLRSEDMDAVQKMAKNLITAHRENARLENKVEGDILENLTKRDGTNLSPSTFYELFAKERAQTKKAAVTTPEQAAKIKADHLAKQNPQNQQNQQQKQQLPGVK